MRIWYGPQRRGHPMPGLGPTTRHSRESTGELQPDPQGVWRGNRRRVDGGTYSRTSVPPSRRRKHRGSR